MSEFHDRAVEAARTVALRADDSPRTIARALQAPLLPALGTAPADRLDRIDRAFAARVAPWEARDAAPVNKQRLVTPWPDILAFFAVTSAMASATGAGRLTGGTSLNSLPVVAPTVIISLAIALVLFAIGAFFAQRERAILLAQYEDSRAVERSGVLWASVALGAIGLIAMVIRLATDDVIPTAIAATALSALSLVASVVLALGARRTAKASASGGKFIHRPRGTARGRQRNEAISASEDARDEVAAALESVSADTRAVVADAYAAAVAEVAARRVLPAAALKRLTPADWIAARYDVEI